MTLRTIIIATILAFCSTALYAEDPAPSPPATMPATNEVPPVKPPTKPNEFLTQDQLVQAFRAKQYQLVIRESSRILTNPIATKKYDDFNLQVLRAESFLQMKDAMSAIPQFEDAAKRAPDDNRRAIMSATALLLRRQHNLQYSTTSTDEDGKLLPPLEKGETRVPTKIDIISLARRNAAIKALFYDELFKADDMVTAAAKSSTLPALTPVIKSLEQLSSLELAATGATKSTAQLQIKLGKTAASLIHIALGEMSRRAAAKRDEARKLITIQRIAPTATSPANLPDPPPQPQGLPPTEVRALETMLADLDKIGPATDELAQRLSLEKKFFQTTIDEIPPVRTVVEDAIDAGKNGALWLNDLSNQGNIRVITH